MSVEKKLLENGKMQVTTITEQDRYTGEYGASESINRWYIDDFMTNNKVWVTNNNREGFEALNTGENWEPSGASIESDIASFQKYLDETYGKDKYKAYALGAYVHSLVSFSFNKGEDTRCKWDSGTIGFVGLEKNLAYNATNLSDAWNGGICEYIVWDNYEDELVDSIDTTSSNKEIDKWKQEMKEKYGVVEYKEEE